jgi:tRNA (guanine-N7-)-methyltransferase
LHKLNPAIDLSKHLLALEQLPRPWNAESVFGRQAPLEVEAGSGKGLFLRTAAAQHPEINYLGIEISRPYSQFIAANLVHDGQTNARIVAGDATQVFSEVFPENALAAVHVYFPDPWWKRRHRKRRLMRESFVHDIERVLQPGGKLHFWTDVEEYFQVTLKLLAAETRLEGPFEVPEPSADSADYRTHFERRTRLEGQPVYRSEFRKQ